jgi:hypothetical protein
VWGGGGARVRARARARAGGLVSTPLAVTYARCARMVVHFELHGDANWKTREEDRWRCVSSEAPFTLKFDVQRQRNDAPAVCLLT